MNGRISSVVNSTASFLMSLGSGLRGVVPPLRSKRGTFGTQRMESLQRDQQRRATYPCD